MNEHTGNIQANRFMADKATATGEVSIYYFLYRPIKIKRESIYTKVDLYIYIMNTIRY